MLGGNWTGLGRSGGSANFNFGNTFSSSGSSSSYGSGSDLSDFSSTGNGVEAFKKYVDLHPDVVLMDITMPEKDGLAATKEITTFDPNATVIMVSAMGQQAKVFEAIANGAKDFIVKPFDPNKIIECIAKYT